MIIAAIPTTPERAELCNEAVEAWKDQFDEVWVMYDSTSYQGNIENCSRIFYHDSLVPDCIPKRTGYCRSYLNYRAWQKKEVEWVVHLDDDVRPCTERLGPFSNTEWGRVLSLAKRIDNRWFTTVPEGIVPRGYPLLERHATKKVKMFHGFALGIPDILGFDQLTLGQNYRVMVPQIRRSEIVSYGHYFPMSGQAVAIHRELLPAAYFTWGGWDLPLNKFGDIWCGVILKKICDHLGWACVINEPVVVHERASDPWKNMEAEASTLKYNEEFWKWVDAVDLEGCETVISCYRQIMTKMMLPDEPSFLGFREKAMEWISLFTME